MSSLALSTELNEMQFLPLPSVATSWLESRRLYSSAEILRNYRQYIKSLSAFFGAVPAAVILAMVRACQGGQR